MRRPLGPVRDPAGVSRLLDDGSAHASAGRLDAAIAAYEQAARLDPSDFRASYSAATLALRRGEPARAIPHLTRVTTLRPDLFEAWHNLGAAAQASEVWALSAAAFERALALRPEADESRRLYAAVLAVLGRIDEAVAEHRRLATRPATRVWALTRLALLRPAAIGAAELAEMQQAGADESLDRETRAGLEFAAGEVLERAGDDVAAFAAFARGNALKCDPVRAAADLASHRAAAMRQAEVFSPERVAGLQGRGLATKAPIFVVGLPRSGSTLIEQILARHSQVIGLGEAAVLPPLLERVDFSSEPRPDLRVLGRAYLTGARSRGWGGAGRFVDKTLENYLHVGAIAAMFPNAVILHAVRGAMDTCLSCYRQLFADDSPTLYDLADIGAEYVAYRGLMDHWRAALPGRVIDVDHEALVADPQGRIRWLVTEACGLTWDEACLTPEQAAGPVLTASAAQVRQPIFRTSVERWRRYQAQLGPLAEALGPYAPAS